MPSRDLPARPNLEQYKKQAKDLLKGWKSADPKTTKKLADAQFEIAREHGFDTWKAFTDRINRLTGAVQKAAIWKAAEDAVVSADERTLADLLQKHGQMLRSEQPETSWFGGLRPDYKDFGARAILAREHHFRTWDECAALQAALKNSSSPESRFEAAVDAVVAGDAATLERALRADPNLIRARSTRAHHSTLLHYVGANGVESWRQRPSRNAPRVAGVLLDSGAEIDAPADMYKGGCTTLGLIATSIHPKTAGVQNELIDLFLARGARLNLAGAGNAHSLVNGCLTNGRPDAAEHLANRGAPLDLEAAAGLGRLEVVKSFFDASGTLKEPATPAQMTAGFLNACGYGKKDVVEYLLDHGMDLNGTSRGETGLHFAALGGHVEIIRTLLTRSPKVDIRDGRFGGEGWRHRWMERGFDKDKDQGRDGDGRGPERL